MQIATIFSECPEIEHTLILEKVLGQGKFHVYQAKAPTLPDTDFALKVFPRTAAATIHFAREKHFLNKVSHTNIITYIPIFQHNLPHDILATEYTPNGDFFDFVTQGGMSNDEKLMRTYFRQFIEGLEYLHAHGIAHLDLKLENLLMDKNFVLKILDFDQAQHVEDDELHSGGTIGYRAPELVSRRFKSLKALDTYAAGVLLFTFVTGEMPFVESKGDKVKKSAMYETFRDDKKKFWREKSKDLNKAFSKELKDLLNGMWEEKVEKRTKIEQVKRSKWYNGEIYTQEELKVEVAKIFQRLRKN